MGTALVTAVMVTGRCPERVPMARVAAACYLTQTWPERELVIVNHGDAELRVPGAREYAVTREQYQTLGDLRNLSLDLCRPGLVVVWDDDDWFDPDYIRVMAQGWRPGKIVCHRSQIRHDIEVNSSFVCSSLKGHHGQVLYDRDAAKALGGYRPFNCGEDTDLLNRWGLENRVVVRNDPGLYVRMAHSWNTWNRHHIMRGLEQKPGRHVGLGRAHLDLVRRVRKLYGRD